MNDPGLRFLIVDDDKSVRRLCATIGASLNFVCAEAESAEAAIAMMESDSPDLILADLPGYGYAKISKEISAEWPKFIEPYLSERESLRLCVCLVDANVPPQKSDRQLIEWLQHHDKELLVVATKADRLSSNQLSKALAQLRREHQVGEILPVSAKTGSGISELWRKVLQTYGSTGGGSRWVRR